MNHQPTHYISESDGSHRTRCSCGYLTERFKNQQDTEDQYRKHLEYIERVKTHLRPKTVSMKGQRDYYEEMAADPRTSPAHRAMWQRLADELSHRLGDRHPGSEDVPLL